MKLSRNKAQVGKVSINLPVSVIMTVNMSLSNGASISLQKAAEVNVKTDSYRVYEQKLWMKHCIWTARDGQQNDSFVYLRDILHLISLS